MNAPSRTQPEELLRKSLESGRIHSAYLVSGAGAGPAEAACRFARGLVCQGPESEARPCETCPACRRSSPSEEPVEIDGTGKSGPLYRHIGDHPDLFWVARGASDTRVRIGQVRALQSALRLGANEGGWRAAVIADAEWLNVEGQNALLHVLEEPPPRTCLILVASSAAALLATIRSRSVRVVFPAEERRALYGADAPEDVAEIALRLDGIERLRVPDLLDWAEEYRGPRAVAAQGVQTLLETGGEWLRMRVTRAAAEPDTDPRRELAAFRTLLHCRRDLVQRNANPQMVAERGLIALREVFSRRATSEHSLQRSSAL
jgi:DNA polymerase III delta prime subunit